MNPPLIKTSYVVGNKAALIRIVLDGVTKPSMIYGEKYSNPMPSQPRMTDQEVADVLTYVRRSFGNNVAPVTASEVKAVRAKG